MNTRWIVIAEWFFRDFLQTFRQDRTRYRKDSISTLMYLAATEQHSSELNLHLVVCPYLATVATVTRDSRTLGTRAHE